VRPGHVVPILLLTLLLAPAAHGATCPGRTLYHAHGIRVTTRVAYYEPHRRYPYDAFYACRAGRRWVILQGDGDADTTMRNIGLHGGRLGFVADEDADVYIAYAGWTDVRTHRTRLGVISEPEGTDEPVVPTDRVEYRIAADGAMAILGGDGGANGRQQVALLEPARKAGRFRACRTLFTAAAGGLVFGTLRVTRDEVSVDRRDGARLTFDR
jgi:hypothetical protein